MEEQEIARNITREHKIAKAKFVEMLIMYKQWIERKEKPSS
jgi:hypothetical protein